MACSVPMMVAVFRRSVYTNAALPNVQGTTYEISLVIYMPLRYLDFPIYFPPVVLLDLSDQHLHLRGQVGRENLASPCRGRRQPTLTRSPEPGSLRKQAAYCRATGRKDALRIALAHSLLTPEYKPRIASALCMLHSTFCNSTTVEHLSQHVSTAILRTRFRVCVSQLHTGLHRKWVGIHPIGQAPSYVCRRSVPAGTRNGLVMAVKSNLHEMGGIGT
jgi:hypothetical protein